MFIPMLIIFGLAEMLIRLTGAAESCPNPTAFSITICDPVLYFKNNPLLPIPEGHLNQANFRGREFLPKKPGVFRILSLGDSCTFGSAADDQGRYVDEPYPQVLERLIGQARGPDRVEVLNAGSPGYNSYQGLMLLRTKLRDLAPDLITVRFGWNDHLMSPLGRDEGAFRESSNSIVRAVRAALLRTALYPFAIRLMLEARSRLPVEPGAPLGLPQEWKPNMSIAEYQYAMRNLAELGRSLGAEVWFLTAPQAVSNDQNLARYDALPSDAAVRTILAFNALPDFARMREIHDTYVETTRGLARELGVRLVDLDALYREANDPRLFSIQDVIHPTQRGHNLEARILQQQLLESGMLDNPLAAASR